MNIQKLTDGQLKDLYEEYKKSIVIIKSQRYPDNDELKKLYRTAMDLYSEISNRNLVNCEVRNGHRYVTIQSNPRN